MTPAQEGNDGRSDRPTGRGDAVPGSRGALVSSGYLGIVILLIISTGFVAVTVVTSLLVGPSRYNRAKYDSYECGIEPTPQPVGGGRFPVKYYITAMLFIVFDIEIVFLYPWAVSFDLMGSFALVEMVLFIVTVFVAYFYVLRRGGLEWD